MSINTKTMISTISARGTIIGKRNTGPESRRTNPVWTSKVENHQDCTLRMKNLRSHWFWHLIDLCHHWCKVCVLSLATCSKFFKVLATRSGRDLTCEPEIKPLLGCLTLWQPSNAWISDLSTQLLHNKNPGKSPMLRAEWLLPETLWSGLVAKKEFHTSREHNQGTQCIRECCRPV